MFSKTVTAICVLVAAFAAVAGRLTPEQMNKLRKMQERPAIVGRDTMSVPGAIIEHWDPPYINDMGEAEYYRTNLIVRIVGEKQPTTWSEVKAELEARAEAAEADAKKTRDIQKAAKKAQKSIDKIKKTIEQAKKKATTEEEIELYDLLLDIIS